MRQLSEDRGAIMVITAAFGSAVLFACAAIAIDVAALYSERRQLQNGADAVAVAIAQSCARGLCTREPASDLADRNTVDGTATVTMVCGSAPGLVGLAGVGSCPAPDPGSRASCGVVPPAGSPPYVEVHTRTSSTDRSTDVVAPFFARAIPDNEDYAGTTVGSCARAGYGSPAAPPPVISILPIVVSKCVVDLYSAGADRVAAQRNHFAPLSLATAAVAAQRPWETEIALHKASGPCTESSSGQTGPGNFGFLTPTSGAGCVVTTTVGASLAGKPGNSPPTVCTDSYLTARLGQIVYIPVSDSISGTGNNLVYHITGYATFYFTGWKLVSSKDHKSILTGQMPCPAGNATCIAGVFLSGLPPIPPAAISPTSPQPSSFNVVQLLR